MPNAKQPYVLDKITKTGLEAGGPPLAISITIASSCIGLFWLAEKLVSEKNVDYFGIPTKILFVLSLLALAWLIIASMRREKYF